VGSFRSIESEEGSLERDQAAIVVLEEAVFAMYLSSEHSVHSPCAV
jgi:hypothetical protein